MIFTIAWRELRSLFLSPLAWCVLGVTQLIYAVIFAGSLMAYLDRPTAGGATASIVGPMFGSSAFVLLFAVPLLTMRTFAEERRNKTDVLLFSAPISMTEIVLGKYVGVILFLFTMFFFILLMAFSLFLGTQVDIGLVGAQLLGSLLLLSSFVAIGIYISTRTESPAIAAIVCFGALLFLWLLEFLRSYINQDLIGYLSIISHYLSFIDGIIDTANVIYYILFIALFLVLAIRHLDSKRLGL